MASSSIFTASGYLRAFTRMQPFWNSSSAWRMLRHVHLLARRRRS